MKFVSQNSQPFQLDVVTVTRTGRTVTANLGNNASPFCLHRTSVPVLVKIGNFNTRYEQSTKYIEASMVLTKNDLDTLYRMVSATELGYSLLLSLPLLNTSWLVTAEVLTATLTVGEDTYYQLSFFDTPVRLSWWRRFLNRFDKSAVHTPMYPVA